MIQENVETKKLMENYYLPEEDIEAINRANIIFKDISKIIRIEQTQKVLDVGFGGGFLLKKFLETTEKENLFGMDISDKYIDKIDFAERNHFCVGDAQDNLDFFEDNFFDIVVSTDVIEHIFDPITFYNNLLRKTKAGGYIFLNIPLELNLSSRLHLLVGGNIHNPFVVGGHIRFFKPCDLNYFNKNNSIIIKKDYDQWFGNPDSLKRRIGLRKKLANYFPSLFAGRVLLCIQKNK